jgi:uncharacterized protein (TIGR04551 family)
MTLPGPPGSHSRLREATENRPDFNVTEATGQRNHIDPRCGRTSAISRISQRRGPTLFVALVFSIDRAIYRVPHPRLLARRLAEAAIFMRRPSLAPLPHVRLCIRPASTLLFAAAFGQTLAQGAFAQTTRPAPATAPKTKAPEAPAATPEATPPATSPPPPAAGGATGAGGSTSTAPATAGGTGGASSGGAPTSPLPEQPRVAEPPPTSVTPVPAEVPAGGVPAAEVNPEPEKKPKKKKRKKSTSAPEESAEESTEFGLGTYPSPEEDAEALSEQGEEVAAVDTDRVFAEDWWTHTRPALELHGNFRVRADLFDHFSLGRIDPPGSAMWPRPLDDSYTDTAGNTHTSAACTPSEAGVSAPTNEAIQGCTNSTQAGANLRFRVEPSIIISNNLRIRSQIDLFDNLVLGSTSQGYSNFPDDGGYSVRQRSGYYPVSGSSWTQDPPVSGINSLTDSIAVKRAWAEYETPFGQARFGRMPDHFGLGLLHNAGDDIDGDNQSTVDRIAVATGLPALGLHAVGAWDFPYEGQTSQAYIQEGRPAYDRAQFDDVSAMNLMLFRRVDRQLERRILARDGVVVNGGLYLTYAFQRIANDIAGSCATGAGALDCGAAEGSGGYSRRGMEVWSPDIYGEVKYKKFRAGVEVVTHQGKFQSLGGQNDSYTVNQWGFAGEFTQLLLEDKLKLGLYFGYASGDGDVEGLVPGSNGLQPQLGDSTISTFRFHPGYRVDMILNRHILSRVQGSYYVKPQVQYELFRDATGMRLGGRAEAIWTRASQFMQAPGHQPDLGIELNGSVYYQSRDGALNDDPDRLGGFFAMLQYGVLFPMSGLGYLAQETTSAPSFTGLQTAQNVRLFLGVAY